MIPFVVHRRFQKPEVGEVVIACPFWVEAKLDHQLAPAGPLVVGSTITFVGKSEEQTIEVVETPSEIANLIEARRVHTEEKP